MPSGDPISGWSVAAQPVGARNFAVVVMLLFGGSIATTIACCSSMSAMAELPMPGGWAMSAPWLRMCGRTWLGAALAFLCMWVPMMVAMMLPSLVPMLWRCRRPPAGPTMTACLGAGYFSVWGLLGAMVFPLGSAFAAIVMKLSVLAQAVPFAAAAIVVLTGGLQCSRWKQHQLACCRRHCRALPRVAGAAWRDGVRLGLHCSRCCAGLTALLLVCGVMNLRVMMAVAIVITAERVAPRGECIARVGGAAMIAVGAWMMVRAASSI